MNNKNAGGIIPNRAGRRSVVERTVAGRRHPESGEGAVSELLVCVCVRNRM